MASLGEVVLYMLIPAAAALAGGAVALAGEPRQAVRSALHHAAAGAIFAAAAAELVVELVAKHRITALIVGFAAGAVLMLLVGAAADRLERRGQGAARAAGFLAAVGIDVFVDGVVVGIGFAIGRSSGVVLVVAFALEMLFLGVSAALELRSTGAGRLGVVAAPAFLALLLILGSIAGHYLGHLSGFGFDAVVAFATAVLVYLVTEELLVEAHAEREEGETPLLAAAFFVSFLGILVLDIALQ